MKIPKQFSDLFLGQVKQNRGTCLLLDHDIFNFILKFLSTIPSYFQKVSGCILRLIFLTILKFLLFRTACVVTGEGVTKKSCLCYLTNYHLYTASYQQRSTTPSVNCCDGYQC